MTARPAPCPPGVARVSACWAMHAFDAHRAVVLSEGPGGERRIHRTSDGGHTWHPSYRDTDPTARYECLAFWDDQHGIALGGSVGRLHLLSTGNGGRSWAVTEPTIEPSAAPPAEPRAAARAAARWWTVSGLILTGSLNARATVGSLGVLHSRDRGRTWRAAMGGAEPPA